MLLVGSLLIFSILEDLLPQKVLASSYVKRHEIGKIIQFVLVGLIHQNDFFDET